MIRLFATTPQLSIPGIPDIKISNETFVPAALSLTFLVIGGLSALFILIGAARYAASAGDPAHIKQARDTILYAVVGLIVSLSAFFIVQFVLGRLI